MTPPHPILAIVILWLSFLLMILYIASDWRKKK